MNDLNLPPRNYDVRGGAYGDQLIAAKHCGLSAPPWGVEGEWQHGWVVKERNIHPEFVVGSDGKSFSRREKGKVFVAREDQVLYLKSCGYKRVVAIGLPIIYLANNQLNRMAGSLLVMPAHSLSETNEQWNDDEYVEYIKSISSHFSRIVVCIHSSCVIKGNWSAFIKAGFEVVNGAEEKDASSLQRMADLFSQFEYLTTNEFGSHVVYASYFGCKVSVIGPRPKFNKEDYLNLTFYKNAPELLGILDDWNQKNFLREIYSRFVVNPWQATTHQEWAAWELGEQNKKSPAELTRLFGWGFQGWLKKVLRWISGKLSRRGGILYNALIKLLILQKYSGIVPAFISLIQLKLARKKQNGICNVWLGWRRRFLIRNGSSDIDVFYQHFIRREILDIPIDFRPMVILDIGANIGLSIEAFHWRFPNAEIIGVELDAENAALCRENLKGYPKVTILNAALWSSLGRVGVRDIGDGAWGFQVDDKSHDSKRYALALTYRDLLALCGLVNVDLLKMDIEGAEADVLEVSADDIFESTMVSIIEVHDWQDGVKERVNNVFEQCRDKYDLRISNNGEFTIVRSERARQI